MSAEDAGAGPFQDTTTNLSVSTSDATLQRRSGEAPDRDLERILRQELSAIHRSVPGLLLRKGSARRLVRTPVHLWR